MTTFGHLNFKATFNYKLTSTVLLICFSQFNYGFETQGYAAIQSMDYFARTFGVQNSTTGAFSLPTTWLSLFNSLGYLTFVCGILIGSVVSNRFGRRMCMFTMSLWAIVCAVITITSTTPNQILAARTLTYVYIGMEMSVVPIYQAEIVPAHARGFVVSTYQLCLPLGGLVINSICAGTQRIDSIDQYRIPFGLFFVVPTIVASLIWFMPESPRWLIFKNRKDEARKALQQFRAGKFTDEQIDAEFRLMCNGINEEHDKGSFWEMFKGQANQRRTWASIAVNFLLQGSGSTFMAQYGALFVKSLGTINQFHYTIINAAAGVISNLVSMTLTDNKKFGRRRLLIFGGLGQTAALLTMGSLSAVTNPTYAQKSGVVAMMIIFFSFFAFGWGPVSHSISAELPSQKLRDVTYRTASSVNTITQFVVAFTFPYMIATPTPNLGGKVGFIYGSVALISVFWAWFFCPDCTGRTLEEIDKLFDDPLIPMRKFHKVQLEIMDDWVVKVASKNGTSVHVEEP